MIPTLQRPWRHPRGIRDGLDALTLQVAELPGDLCRQVPLRTDVGKTTVKLVKIRRQCRFDLQNRLCVHAEGLLCFRSLHRNPRPTSPFLLSFSSVVVLGPPPITSRLFRWTFRSGPWPCRMPPSPRRPHGQAPFHASVSVFAYNTGLPCDSSSPATLDHATRRLATAALAKL